MRIATICAMAISISLVAGAAVAQNSVANALAGAGTLAPRARDCEQVTSKDCVYHQFKVILVRIFSP